MPIQAIWDNEDKTVVRFIYSGKWNWDEFYFTIQSANAMMDTVDHPCLSIVDKTDSRYMPSGAAIHIRNVVRMSRSHNNSGISIFLNSETMARLLIEILKKTYPDIAATTEWHFLTDLEEARALAQRLLLKLRASRQPES